MEKISFSFAPTTIIEKAGIEIYSLLVENFSKTFFVGGMVRDLLLGRSITDIDITTSLLPKRVKKILLEKKIQTHDKGFFFGTISAVLRNKQIEITTLRTEKYTTNRYPKIAFTTNTYLDSLRRDFTINSLYLSQKEAHILDFHGGLKDLQKKFIRSIGDPQKKFTQDPLRIIRALRFEHELHFRIEKSTKLALEKNLHLVSRITTHKRDTELKKIKNTSVRKKITEYLSL